MRRFIISVCVIVGFMVCLSSMALAQTGGKINYGKLAIIPSLTLQEVYDDNIYLRNGTDNQNNREEGDYITHVMPGLLLNYKLDGRGDVRLGYQGDLAYYGENNQNNWRNHKGLFGLDYAAPAGLIVGLNNLYTHAEDPYGNENLFKLGTPQTKRWSDDLATKWGWDFQNRFRVFAYYNYFKQDYDQDADFSQDWDANEVGAGFQMRIYPKTWGFFRYHYGKRDYFTHPAGTGSTDANDADSDWHRVNAGLTWDSGAKLSGELNVGYRWMDYENQFDPTGDRYEPKDTWIASTAITYTATPATTFVLSIIRALRFTGGDSSEFFEDTGAGLTLIQQIWTRFSVTATASYSFYEFNLPAVNPKEHDNYLGAVGLNYKIQDWLSTGFDYKYTKKSSNYIEDEYTDNQVSLYLRAIY